MKRMVFFISLSLVFFYSLCLAEGNVLQLKLSSDKSIYGPGDPVVMTVSVENVSSEQIKVVVIPYSFSNVFDSGHNRCKQVGAEAQLEPESKTDALLGPGQTKVFEITGLLNKSQAGIVWDTGIWGNRYLLRGPGRYDFDFYISASHGNEFQFSIPIPPVKGSFEVAE